MATVRLRNIHKSFGQVPVLHDINIQIENGEFVVLVGPSGCGKSTLLRMLAGLEHVTAGTVEIDERIMNNVAPGERNIAMVFQSYALYPHMNVSENIGLALRLSKVDKATVDEKVRWAADLLGLSELLDRRPSQLSGGQRQRVAMGRAIVRNPDVFLFDEPLSNLDAKLRVQMRTEIRALHQDLKATTVYVTHDQIEAMTMADRIIVMDKGKILQWGTPLEIYDEPNDLRVAGFIGSPSMNFLHGVSTKNGSLVLDNSSDSAKPTGLPKPLFSSAGSHDPAGKYVLGVRPEHITISKGNKALFQATVRVVEQTGADTIVSLQMGDRELTAVARERMELRPRQEVSLNVLPGKAHLFEVNSGLRVK